jgi:hypothetical protein
MRSHDPRGEAAAIAVATPRPGTETTVALCEGCRQGISWFGPPDESGHWRHVGTGAVACREDEVGDDDP